MMAGGVMAGGAERVGVDEAIIRRVLDDIKDPCSVAAAVPMGLDEMGIIKSVAIAADGQVAIELRLTSPFCEMLAFMRNETLAKVGQLPGVTGVTVCNDSGFDWDHDLIAPAAQARRQDRLAKLRERYIADFRSPAVQAINGGAS